MININVITFRGLKGADFQYSYSGTDAGVAIHFPVDKAHVFGERQAFKLVQERIGLMELAWVEPR